MSHVEKELKNAAVQASGYNLSNANELTVRRWLADVVAGVRKECRIEIPIGGDNTTELVYSVVEGKSSPEIRVKGRFDCPNVRLADEEIQPNNIMYGEPPERLQEIVSRFISKKGEKCE